MRYMFQLVDIDKYLKLLFCKIRYGYIELNLYRLHLSLLIYKDVTNMLFDNLKSFVRFLNNSDNQYFIVFQLLVLIPVNVYIATSISDCTSQARNFFEQIKALILSIYSS